MSVHDVGHAGYDRQHTGFKTLVVRGYRAGCIMDWLESVAGWGLQSYDRPYFDMSLSVAIRQRIDHISFRNWTRIAKDWQNAQDGKRNISCTVPGCDGVVV